MCSDSDSENPTWVKTLTHIGLPGSESEHTWGILGWEYSQRISASHQLHVSNCHRSSVDVCWYMVLAHNCIDNGLMILKNRSQKKKKNSRNVHLLSSSSPAQHDLSLRCHQLWTMSLSSDVFHRFTHSYIWNSDMFCCTSDCQMWPFAWYGALLIVISGYIETKATKNMYIYTFKCLWIYWSKIQLWM